MSNKTNNGGPAFPHDDRAQYTERAGMTLRDYFAAKAMQTLLSEVESTADLMGVPQSAYWIADAMLRAREAEND